MDMDTGNTSSETGSLTQAQAVEHLDALLAGDTATDGTEENSAAPDEVTETAAEQADEHSPEDDVTDDGEQDADAPDEDAEQEATAIDENTQFEIDGSTVTLAELKKGYMRQANFTQKTTALAEERKAFEGQRDTLVVNVQQELRTRADMYAKIAQSLALPMPDPNMAFSNAEEYTQARVMWEQQQAGINALIEEGVALDKQTQAKQVEQFEQAKTAGYGQLLEMHPELQDKATIGKLKEYGLKTFTADELAGVADPRMFSVLWKAAQWDDHMAANAKVKHIAANKPALSKPGASTGASNSREDARKAMARLSSTNSVEDAYAFFNLPKRK